MGINVIPSDSNQFRLRQTITTSQNVDLGQVRRAFVVLAGGGGSGAVGVGGLSGGGGGGVAGVVAGTLEAKWIGFSIGAGGAAVSANNTAGNDGNPSYMFLPSNNHNNPSNAVVTYQGVHYIAACGGQRGFPNLGSNASGNISFANVTSPTVTNFSNWEKVFGCSGSCGGGGSGSGSGTVAAQTQNIISTHQISWLNGWDTNLPTYSTNDSAVGSGNNFIPTAISTYQQQSYYLDTASGLTSYTGARTRWTTNTTATNIIPGGNGGVSGSAGIGGSSGQFAGSGGGGAGDNNVGGPGGGGRWFLAGLGGTTTGSGGGGGGGGGGVAGSGADGGASTTSLGGTGGAGGLGGGGGGASGGNSSGTTARLSGKGGDGVALIFY